MFTNRTRLPNDTRPKLTGYPAGGVREAAEQTAAYFAALALIVRIDDSLRRGSCPYRNNATGQPLTTLDEVVRAMLADTLVMTESLCQDCLRPNPAHPENKGKCARCGGQTCSCLFCLDTLARLRAGERDKVRLGLRVNLASWSEQTGAILSAEEV